MSNARLTSTIYVEENKRKSKVKTLLTLIEIAQVGNLALVEFLLSPNKI